MSHSGSILERLRPRKRPAKEPTPSRPTKKRRPRAPPQPTSVPLPRDILVEDTHTLKDHQDLDDYMAHVLVAVPIEKTVALILTHVVLSAPWLDQALGREDLMTARLKDIGSWHVWLTELVQDCHSCSQYQRLRRLRFLRCPSYLFARLPRYPDTTTTFHRIHDIYRPYDENVGAFLKSASLNPHWRDGAAVGELNERYKQELFGSGGPFHNTYMHIFRNNVNTLRKRVLLDGLCHRWGVYISPSTFDPIGRTRDLPEALQRTQFSLANKLPGATYPSSCMYIGAVLMARLLVWRSFAMDTWELDPSERQRLWVHAQIAPESALRSPDGSSNLFTSLSRSLRALSVEDMVEGVRGLQQQLDLLLPKDDPSTPRMYVVMDFPVPPSCDSGLFNDILDAVCLMCPPNGKTGLVIAGGETLSVELPDFVSTGKPYAFSRKDSQMSS